jgi:hypothetical protein
MFIGKVNDILDNPEGIVCKYSALLHIIPSGLMTFFHKIL